MPFDILVALMEKQVTPKVAVETRIERLQSGYSTADGWKLLVDDFDQQDSCTRHEHFFSFDMSVHLTRLATCPQGHADQNMAAVL